MSFSAHFFTISPENLETALKLSEEEAIKYIEKVRENFKVFEGKGLAEFFASCDCADKLLTELGGRDSPLEQMQFLGDILGLHYVYYPSDIGYIVESLTCCEVVTSEPGCDDWTSYTKRFLGSEEGQDARYTQEELIQTMLELTDIFVLAKEKGHIVINYWG